MNHSSWPLGSDWRFRVRCLRFDNEPTHCAERASVLGFVLPSSADSGVWCPAACVLCTVSDAYDPDTSGEGGLPAP